MFSNNKLYKLFILILIYFLNIFFDKYYIKYHSFDKIKNENLNNQKFNYVKSSKEYWEQRYKKGGNSGPGSYHHLANFKAEVINNFIIKNNINTVIEWGSGDCNQVSLINYKKYFGYDVSKSAINLCKTKFKNDRSKTFIYIDQNFKNKIKGDLSISLDVIFHLIEDDVFNKYMKNLFDSSNKYVCIYSSNSLSKPSGKYTRQRIFTDWIDIHESNKWKLKEFIPNKFPFDNKKMSSTSFSDFYFYEKIECKFSLFKICIYK